MIAKTPLRIGTRGSPLALAQAAEVVARLRVAHPSLTGPVAIETVVITTTGDRVTDRSLAEIGGKGLFTKEIDEALLGGRIDLAVHSMKDVPTGLPNGLVVSCILEREDCRDAFIAPAAPHPSALPAGAVVGTASLRRAAQLLHRYPALRTVPLRGNVETRLSKLAAGQVDAVLLAAAGLRRLGLIDRATCLLDSGEMLPAVAQGAIGIACRRDDGTAQDWLRPLDHGESHDRVLAERAFLAALDGSCRTPIAGLATLDGDHLSFRGLIVRPDGGAAYAVEDGGHRSEAESIGRRAAEDLRRRAGPDFLRER